MIALAYGLRRGEVLGPHWSALDWQVRTLGITHGVKRIKNRDSSSVCKTQLVVSELKTPRSRRTLALTPEIMAKLREHRAGQAQARIAAGPLLDWYQASNPYATRDLPSRHGWQLQPPGEISLTG
jgi:integrase